MKKHCFAFLLAGSMAFAQYKLEPAAAAPSGLAPAFAADLQPGLKILNASGAVYCEVWFRNTLPSGPKSTEDSVVFPTIPHGALLGVIHFPANGADRRGQSVKPGLYTLRYSLYPVNGDHLGVAPQRDFLVLVPAAEDKDPASMPKFDELMALSRKASGTPHPAVLSIGTGSADKVSALAKEGDHDWVLTVKIGAQPVSVILIGKAEG